MAREASSYLRAGQPSLRPSECNSDCHDGPNPNGCVAGREPPLWGVHWHSVITSGSRSQRRRWEQRRRRGCHWTDTGRASWLGAPARPHGAVSGPARVAQARLGHCHIVRGPMAWPMAKCGIVVSLGRGHVGERWPDVCEPAAGVQEGKLATVAFPYVGIESGDARRRERSTAGQYMRSRVP